MRIPIAYGQNYSWVLNIFHVETVVIGISRTIKYNLNLNRTKVAKLVDMYSVYLSLDKKYENEFLNNYFSSCLCRKFDTKAGRL